jgi:DNA-binding NtrC family response regulator
MLRLVVAFGDRERQFNLPIDAKGTLGSAADNDFVVTWPGVSGHHATVERVGERILIKDSGSKNGIVIGGVRRDRVNLAPGDTAQIGRAGIRVEEIATSDADLAVSFDRQSSSHGTAGFRTDTEGLEGIDERGMASALRWARDASSSASLTAERRRTLLESAAAIVGSSALLVCSNEGDLFIGEVVGALPDDEEIDALASRPVRRDSRWFYVPVGDGMMLAAHPSGIERFSSWQREFLDHVGETLFGPEQDADNRSIRTPNEVVFPSSMVLGTSPAMRLVRDRVRMAVQSGLHVLLRGESGTGKELIARAIHDSSCVRGPFRAINCAAIPNELFEAEMFGIRAGVATGVEKRSGHFIEAEGGTVFLDEIGDLPAAAQAKLLRVLQEREVLPVGASTPVKINLRVVASTNRDLETLIRAGSYRADLYYRLRGIEITLPPLRERREDIPSLAVAFASRASTSASKRIRGISRKALVQLSAFPWPGNIRELENIVGQAIARCPSGGTIETSHLGLPFDFVPHDAGTLQAGRQIAENDTIIKALRRANGNKTEAAGILGISRQALYKKLKGKMGE